MTYLKMDNWDNNSMQLAAIHTTVIGGSLSLFLSGSRRFMHGSRASADADR